MVVGLILLIKMIGVLYVSRLIFTLTPHALYIVAL